MIITGTVFGTSKKGNTYCLMSTIDASGISGKGVLMTGRAPKTPEIGDTINGFWNTDGFLVSQ